MECEGLDRAGKLTKRTVASDQVLAVATQSRCHSAFIWLILHSTIAREGVWGGSRQEY